jgi:hypothetical protein
MANEAESMRCPLCGMPTAERNDVVEVHSRVMHAACVESAPGPRPAWKHGDVNAWTEWARGVGWGSSVVG